MQVKIEQAFKVFNPPLFDRTEIWQGTESGTLAVKLLFQAFYKSLIDLGYSAGNKSGDVAINWGGKRSNQTSETLYFEHAWGPRHAYQFSSTGVNYNHRCSNSRKSLTQMDVREAKLYRDRIVAELSRFRTKNFIEPENDFVLVPLQTPRNNYFTDVDSRFSKFALDKSDSAYWGISQEIILAVEELDLGLPVIYVQDPRDLRDYASELIIKSNSKFITSKHGRSIHDYLSSDKCKFVVGINTNALNEAIFWGRDVISFGELIDNKNNRIIPSSVDGVMLSDNEDLYWEYMVRLYRNTWYLSDFVNPIVVKEIITSMGKLDRVDTMEKLYV
ncbi:MAG: hypothetical protein RPR97_15525 [Colwellia sp.]|jgi:hypothetical protein